MQIHLGMDIRQTNWPSRHKGAPGGLRGSNIQKSGEAVKRLDRLAQERDLCACAGAGHCSEFAPVNIHSKLHFRLNIITFSRNSNLHSSSGGKKPFRFKFACKISQIFEIMYSLCSAGAGNPGNHAHD